MYTSPFPRTVFFVWSPNVVASLPVGGSAVSSILGVYWAIWCELAGWGLGQWRRLAVACAQCPYLPVVCLTTQHAHRVSRGGPFVAGLPVGVWGSGRLWAALRRGSRSRFLSRDPATLGPIRGRSLRASRVYWLCFRLGRVGAGGAVCRIEAPEVLDATVAVARRQVVCATLSGPACSREDSARPGV